MTMKGWKEDEFVQLLYADSPPDSSIALTLTTDRIDRKSVV